VGVNLKKTVKIYWLWCNWLTGVDYALSRNPFATSNFPALLKPWRW